MKCNSSFNCLLVLIILFCCQYTFTQNNVVNTVTNRHGKETSRIQNQKVDNLVPEYLMDQYNAAKDSYNGEEKQRVMTEIQKYLTFSETNTSTILQDFKPARVTEPPFNPDWYSTDITVHTGDVANYGYRQIDLKQGEDGWMYLAINRRNVSGYNGSISVYRSSNGGANWALIQGVNSAANFFQSISMLVENRSSNNSNPDSTRILVYFIAAPATNWNGANLAMVSFRRNGTSWFSQTVASPMSGNKFQYVSACSDGQYYDVNTYMHIIVHEAANNEADVGFRHLLTMNWGTLYIMGPPTGSALYTDVNPSSAYCDLNGDDEIYVAMERWYETNDHRLVYYTIPEIPQAGYNSFIQLVSSPNYSLYEKPEITIVQQRYIIPKKIAITCTRNNNPRWFYTSNGGSSWTLEELLGPNTSCLADFTTCNSDSLTAGGQYVILGYVSNDGDSVNVKQTSIPPTTTYSYYKRNSHNSTGSVAPSTSIYKIGTVKNAAFAYCGVGPANVYYNAEQLLTGINPVSNIADKYELKQNYPNPFNPSTKIDFSIPKPGLAKLIVYDLTGREVSVVVDKELSIGTYSVDFDGSNLASGVYFYKIISGDYTQMKKMILVK